jgi:NTE family protein
MDVCEDSSAPESPRIALALSGGGSRAMAFHLGCLRGLHRASLLDQVSVISSVSGGSVLAALYCSEPGDFEAFEYRVRAILARGFVVPALQTALTTLEGMKAVAAVTALAIDRLTAFAARRASKLLWLPFGQNLGWLRETPLRRWASRTTILQRTFSALFSGRRLPELRADRPRLIIVACELRAKAPWGSCCSPASGLPYSICLSSLRSLSSCARQPPIAASAWRQMF